MTNAEMTNDEGACRFFSSFRIRDLDFLGHWWVIVHWHYLRRRSRVKCQFCNNQATVHVTDIANKRKRELHLCEKCARKHNLIPDQPTPHVDLKALLGLLIGPLQQQHQAS